MLLDTTVTTKIDQTSVLMLFLAIALAGVIIVGVSMAARKSR